MTHIFLIIIAVLLLIIIAVLIWLVIQNKKLKREHIALTEYVARSSRDIASLCSAAVAVDDRMLTTDEMVRELVEKIADFAQTEQTSQPYHSAIQQARSGVSIDELMHSSGLSRDEAALLIRLHGGVK